MATPIPPNLHFFFLRFKAFVIDLFMIYTPILYFTTYVILGSKEAFLQNQWAIFICVFSYGVIDSLCSALLSQTPGMKAQDLILQTAKGNKVSFALALLRFVLFCLSLALFFGFFFPFLRKDRQTFHDWICQTQIKLS